MKNVKLQIEHMLPRIIEARAYQLLDPNIKMPKRTVSVYELGFYIEGGGTIYYNGEAFPVRCGDVRFSVPGSIINSSPKYKCYTLLFDFGKNNVIYENQVLDNIPAYSRGNGEHVHFFEQIIRSYMSNDPAEKLRGNALLMQLLFTLYSSRNSNKASSDAVERCKKYMEDNCKEEITLQKLGDLTGYSHIHIMRLFKKEVGLTPHRWLTEIRIGRAKRLLGDSSATLEEIAEKCGFSSTSHFKTLFKERTGFTPGAYRKNTSRVY